MKARYFSQVLSGGNRFNSWINLLNKGKDVGMLLVNIEFFPENHGEFTPSFLQSVTEQKSYPSINPLGKYWAVQF